MNQNLIVANWKMFKTNTQAEILTKELITKLSDFNNVEIVICPTYTSLDRVRNLIKNTNIKLGAQDLHWQEQGAYTGKISGDMLYDLEVVYVIIGHSEQRTYFNETDETVNKKINAALKNLLKPIVCVGETLEQREKGNWKEVITKQIEIAFQNINNENFSKCIIAYEPVWAIGTGRIASTAQASEVHGLIRELVYKLTKDTNISKNIKILYGGSVKPENASELFKVKDIDGGLIGGASLDANSFASIVKAGIN